MGSSGLRDRVGNKGPAWLLKEEGVGGPKKGPI